MSGITGQWCEILKRNIGLQRKEGFFQYKIIVLREQELNLVL